MSAKRLELLRQLVPGVKSIAMLVNPDSPNTVEERRDVQAARKSSDSQSFFSMSTAITTSRQPLLRSPSAALVRCSSVPARF